MKRIVLASLLCLAGAPALANDLTASAILRGQTGEAFGTVTLTQTPHGVLVQASLQGLSTAGHGFHIHEVGSCANGFKGAGGHYNPHGSAHGMMSTGAYHAGDLPNVYGAADGTARVDILATQVSLTDGPATVFDADGSAFIVHAKPDDYADMSSAGPRLACGVITKD